MSYQPTLDESLSEPERNPLEVIDHRLTTHSRRQTILALVSAALVVIVLLFWSYGRNMMLSLRNAAADGFAAETATMAPGTAAGSTGTVTEGTLTSTRTADGRTVLMGAGGTGVAGGVPGAVTSSSDNNVNVNVGGPVGDIGVPTTLPAGVPGATVAPPTIPATPNPTTPTTPSTPTTVVAGQPMIALELFTDITNGDRWADVQKTLNNNGKMLSDVQVGPYHTVTYDIGGLVQGGQIKVTVDRNGAVVGKIKLGF